MSVVDDGDDDDDDDDGDYHHIACSIDKKRYVGQLMMKLPQIAIFTSPELRSSITIKAATHEP